MGFAKMVLSPSHPAQMCPTLLTGHLEASCEPVASRLHGSPPSCLLHFSFPHSCVVLPKLNITNPSVSKMPRVYICPWIPLLTINTVLQVTWPLYNMGGGVFFKYRTGSESWSDQWGLPWCLPPTLPFSVLPSLIEALGFRYLVT